MTPRAWSLSAGVLALYAAACALAPLWLDPGLLRLAGEVLLMVAMAQMWNLLAGYTGLISMGHQVFIGIGAYLLFYVSDRFDIHPFLLVPVAGGAAALVAVAVAPLLFRLRDAYFSIGIWVFSEIVLAFASKTRELGATSGVALKATRLVDVEHFARNTFWIAALLAALAVAGVYALMRSRLGLALMTVRDNELAATSIGVDVGRNRRLAFAISAFGCGAAGATQYMAAMFVTPDAAFDVNWVVVMMFIVIIGGIGTIEGPLIGALLYFGLREFLASWFSLSGSLNLVATGAIAVFVMAVAPRGLWGWARERWGWQGLVLRRHPPSST
ncbi:MAG: branched-chain amino acid ABC transporter permease [Burkholderiales bacterium]|nr:branched-chain amino acid ABC transporter permease [Burkholderiales bacterium]